MNVHIDLTKKAEQVTFILEKKGVAQAPTMRVCAALDISGSMDDEIRDGSLQRAMDQLGGIGIKFDDNGEIDVWKFDNYSNYIGTWNPSDYKTYIKANRIEARGGTAYSPFINDIREHMFGATTKKVAREVVVEKKGFLGFGKKSEVNTVYDTVTVPGTDQTPVLVMVITDGEPLADRYENITRALNGCESIPAFFVFVGINNQGEQFKTLQRLQNECSNASFVKLNGFNVSDEDLYTQVISDKLVGFLKRF